MARDPDNIVSVHANTSENNQLNDNSLYQTYSNTQGENTGGAEIIWDSRKGAQFTNVKGFFSLITDNGYSEEGQISPQKHCCTSWVIHTTFLATPNSTKGTATPLLGNIKTERSLM